jgi:arsenate reductase (thioredoxin)
MAEGLLRQAAGERFDVYSAGTTPGGISDLTIEVMREIGVDVSGQRSKSVDEYEGESFHHVITVCDSARQVCPTFPGDGERLHWDIEDPSDTEARGVPLTTAFRLAREDIRKRVEEFVAEY